MTFAYRGHGMRLLAACLHSTIVIPAASAWIQPFVPILSHPLAGGGNDARRHYHSSLAASSFGYRNHLEEASCLKNDFFAMRHGQSMANVAGLIASNPNIACTAYGLSTVGKEQAIQAGATVVERYQQQQQEIMKANGNCYQGVLILSSDLLRAKETAETVAKAVQKALIPLYDDRVVIETRLRERGFGEWDGGSDEHYQDVWKEDVMDPTHEIKSVESVLSVMDRASTSVLEWDEKVQNHFIICVAHGDVLQILQTAFSKLDGSKHRTLDHLETATLRPLLLEANSP
jgi:broad specificity phosphatase PhoE